MSTTKLIYRLALPVMAVVLIALAALNAPLPESRVVSDGGLPAGVLKPLLDEADGAPAAEIQFTFEQAALYGR